MNLESEQREVEELSARIKHLEASREEGEKKVASQEVTVKRSQDAQEVLQRIAQAVQQKAHERISAVVSSCLEIVFDDPYEFKIDFERKRGRTEAHLRFARRELDVDPLTASGGGVVDVAAFALRVSCLMLSRPRLGRLVVLDEPFKFVSEEYRANVKEMLEKLAKDLKLQIIQVTHITELETGTIIDL